MLALRATVISAAGLEKAYNVQVHQMLIATIISVFFVVMIFVVSKNSRYLSSQLGSAWGAYLSSLPAAPKYWLHFVACYLHKNESLFRVTFYNRGGSTCRIWGASFH